MRTTRARRYGRTLLTTVAALSLLATACAGSDADGDTDTGEPAADDGATSADSGDTGDAEDTGDAGDYPTESLRVIITFDPGGGSDTDFRRLQPHLEEALGVTLEPDYVTGAGGAIGWTELANAEPDGQTIGTVVLPHIILQPELIADTGYATDDFEIISMNAQAPQMLFTNASNPAFEDFAAFEEAATAEPGSINVGGSAEFNLSHVVQAQLGQAGLETNWVATGEGSTSVTAGVLGNQFPVGITSIQAYVGREDELLPLAISSEGSYEHYPEIPTFSELGYEITGATNWGLAAPKGTDPAKIQVIADAVAEAMETQDVQDNLASEAQSAIGLGPEESAEYLAEFRQDILEITPVFQQ